MNNIDTDLFEIKSNLDYTEKCLQVINFILENKNKLPIYLHCREGKDRTGYFTDFLLILLNFNKEVFLKEHKKSKECHPDNILNQITDTFILFYEKNKNNDEFKKKINELKEIFLN
jgi:protein tyrosine/serine phosphatase